MHHRKTCIRVEPVILCLALTYLLIWNTFCNMPFVNKIYVQYVHCPMQADPSTDKYGVLDHSFHCGITESTNKEG